jgi:2-keto-3-deoxy-L-rhamnonate aldolase RhmA
MTVFGVAAAARAAQAQGQGSAPVIPSWSNFRPQPGSVKAKMHSGQTVRQASPPVDATRAQLEAIIKKQGQVDLFNLDGQHSPMPTERELVRFCTTAAELGVGVQLRIPHPRLAFLTGRYADLGILSVFIPLVEDVETVNAALDNFYFPPLGNRSWGGNLMVAQFGVGGGQAPPPYTDQFRYAQWWNSHACLGLQIERLRAAVNVRSLVRPGVDWVGFGAGDMGFDIARHSNSPFKSVDEAHNYIIDQLQGYDIRLPGRPGGGKD